MTFEVVVSSKAGAESAAAGGSERGENASRGSAGPRERVHVTALVSRETMEDFYAGTTGALSYGMAFVATDEPPPPGAEVALSIQLPGGNAIEADGSVQWIRRIASLPSQPAGCGVAWQTYDPAAVEVVQKYIADSDYTFSADAI